MKKLLIFSCTIFIFSLTYAQDKQERTIGDFNEVALGISADVYIKKGNSHKVVLEGDADDIKEIETIVKGNRLKISHKSNNWWGSRKIGKVTVYVTMPGLNAVRVSGSGRVKSDDTFITKAFDGAVSGSGKMSLKIQAQETDLSISGSGKIDLNGKSEATEISISGSGNIDAIDFQVAEAKIKISGSGNCSINVTESLRSNISGSGNVKYTGSPKNVHSNSSGSGRTRKI